jgi:hypothetical protein
MLKVQMGRAYSIFDHDKIDAVASDLRKHLGGITVERFRAKLPLFTTFSRPRNPRKAERKESNYVLVKRRGKPVLEFYGSGYRANGHIFEENISREDSCKMAAIMANHDYYTFGMFKKMHPEIRLMMIVLGMLLVFMGSLLALSGATMQDAVLVLLTVCVAVFGAGLLKLYTY